MTLSLDNLPDLMEYLHSALTHVGNRSLIIYTHCEVEVTNAKCHNMKCPAHVFEIQSNLYTV